MKESGAVNDDALKVPRIDPVPEGEARPFWSVMIPTFNCALYLRQTLESVLAQDLGPEVMQIEVIDDCSYQDAPELVVQEVGRGRVAFFRQAENVGHTANFLTCLRRARGHVVHLLHGDDYVRLGFYSKLAQAFSKDPSIGAAFCRHIIADGNGHWMQISALEREEAGIFPDAARKLASKQRIQTPSIVVRRSVFERLGSFDQRLTWTEDWEMWVRIAAHYPIWFDPEPLAVYRVHAGSSTSLKTLTGENIRDLRRCIHTFKNYFPAKERHAIEDTAMQIHAGYALTLADQLFHQGHKKAALIQMVEALKCSSRLSVFYSVCRTVATHLLCGFHRTFRNLGRKVMGARKAPAR